MSIAITVIAKRPHPNRLGFRGILTLIDVPSDRAPAGARGHRVILTRAAAQAAIPSLLGMGLDYTASFDGHDARRKVGIITEAEIISEGRRTKEEGRSAMNLHPSHNRPSSFLAVRGYLFAKDFPDVVRELRQHAHRLGMSYEIADARVANLRDPVWRLTEVLFTGAAVLRRDKAAYSKTSIELLSTQ